MYRQMDASMDGWMYRRLTPHTLNAALGGVRERTIAVNPRLALVRAYSSTLNRDFRRLQSSKQGVKDFLEQLSQHVC